MTLRRKPGFVSLILGAWLFCCAPVLAAEHVILISVDGLRADAITALGPKKAPNLHFLIEQGAATLNARTDADLAVTLPNHTCMLTGLGVNGDNGHNYHDNGEPTGTLHEVKGRYLPSIFDVVYKKGLRTALFASKLKFKLYLKSYSELINSAQINAYDDAQTIQAAVQELTTHTPHFMFIHVTAPDHTGHHAGWDLAADSPYLKAVQDDDALIGQLLLAIQQNDRLRDTTAVIVTADHGGHDKTHGDMDDPRDITIPFLVWGADVAKGADLYTLNPQSRKDPGSAQIPYEAEAQPIRNGDAANLALSLLGLPTIENSTINALQDLLVK